MQAYSIEDLNNLFSLPSTKKLPKKPTTKLSCVYSILCKETKSLYIGSSQFTGHDKDDKSPSKCPRLKYHKSRLSKGKHPNKAIQSDWMFYSDSFVFKVLLICQSSEARQQEQLTIMRVKELGQYKLYNTNNAYRF